MPSPYDHLVSQFLVHSYLYYRLDDSVIQDHVFDALCHTLLDHFDELEHPHKDLLTKEMLSAGTGYSLDFDSLPTITKHCAEAFHARVPVVMATIPEGDRVCVEGRKKRRSGKLKKKKDV